MTAATFNATVKKVVDSLKKTEKPKYKKLKISYTYLMRNNRNGYIKIGYSGNPTFREATLQSEEPKIDLIFKVKTVIEEELFLHEKFSQKRIRGEWFNLNDQDLEEAKEYLLSKEVK
jgi:hypothetical protein